MCVSMLLYFCLHARSLTSGIECISIINYKICKEKAGYKGGTTEGIGRKAQNHRRGRDDDGYKTPRHENTEANRVDFPLCSSVYPVHLVQSYKLEFAFSSSIIYSILQFFINLPNQTTAFDFFFQCFGFSLISDVSPNILKDTF